MTNTFLGTMVSRIIYFVQRKNSRTVLQNVIASDYTQLLTPVLIETYTAFRSLFKEKHRRPVKNGLYTVLLNNLY